MKRMTITIDLEVPDGVEVVAVNAVADQPEVRTAVTASSPSDSYEDRIAQAPEKFQKLLTSYAERCREELGCTIEVPSGKRDDYLTVRHPSCKARVASFMVRYSNNSSKGFGPRAEIYCDPKHVESHPPAEFDFHNGTPVQAKIYFDSDKAIDAAVALTGIAIEEKSKR